MSRFDTDPLFEGVSFEDALERARSEHLCVVASFFAAWCLPSRRLLTAICADSKAVRFLRERAIVVRIDGEEHPDLRERYGVEAYPTLLILGDEGAERGRLVGHVEPDALVERIASILRTPAPPAVPDRDREPATLLRRARERADAGDEPGALAALWRLFEETGAPDRLRLGFVLQEIAELGRAYAPATAALRAARDERERALLAGESTARAADEYAALNESLDETDRTLSVFERLKARAEAEPLRAIATRLVQLFLRRGAYEDLYRYAGRNAWFFRREMARAVQGSEAWWVRFQVEAGCCFETTLALGHDVEAREVADSAIECLPTLQTFATLLDAALAAGRTPVARDLLARAQQELDRADALRLERRLASA